MSEVSSTETLPKKKRSKWVIGCSIGCGAILLIFIILVGMGYYLVKESIVAFEEATESMKSLEEQYGKAGNYCPEPDGNIKTERIEAFLKVRENLIPHLEEMKQSLVHLIDEINRAEQEDSFWNVVGIIKDVSKALPKLAKYFTTRNRNLMEVGMGLGEYYYIYVVAYYAWLGKSPGDGPDFRFIEGKGKNRALYFAMEEMLKDKDGQQEQDEDDSWEGEGIGTFSRLRGFILPMMECQLKKLRESAPGEKPGSWQEALEKEIEAMVKDRSRVPWQEGLPEVLQASLRPFRERLETAYGKLMNPLEFGFHRR